MISILPLPSRTGLRRARAGTWSISAVGNSGADVGRGARIRTWDVACIRRLLLPLSYSPTGPCERTPPRPGCATIPTHAVPSTVAEPPREAAEARSRGTSADRVARRAWPPDPADRPAGVVRRGLRAATDHPSGSVGGIGRPRPSRDTIGGGSP